jgi:ABC-type antimicrobial peptide transport system permease subunit
MTRLLSRLPITSGLIQGVIAPSVIALGFAVALAMGLCGAAYPAWWSARLRPVEALRSK